MSDKSIFLIAGLGNPGNEYENTRHNFGFMAVNAWAENLGIAGNFKEKKDFKSLIADANVEGKKIIIAKPQTYMNLSGSAVQKIMSFYQVIPENILIVHDELDLAFGKIKFSFGSGPAGHNGIKSIISQLGNQEFTRLRLGINNPEKNPNIPSEDFVLKKFSKDEKLLIAKKMPVITEAINFFIQNGFEKSASKYN